MQERYHLKKYLKIQRKGILLSAVFLSVYSIVQLEKDYEKEEFIIIIDN